MAEYHAPSQAVGEPGDIRPKRNIKLTWKALQNAIDAKRREADTKRIKLQGLIRSLEQSGDNDEDQLRALEVTTEEYRFLIHELARLYEQDSHGDYKVDEALLVEEERVVNYANTLVTRKRSQREDRASEISSRHSRHSKSRSSVSTSSSVRLRALAEAAAAQENAEYERIIAEKEKELAVLSANKKAAVATAKLKAIERAIKEEEMPERIELPEIPTAHTGDRTKSWVHSHQDDTMPMVGRANLVPRLFHLTAPAHEETFFGGGGREMKEPGNEVADEPVNLRPERRLMSA